MHVLWLVPDYYTFLVEEMAAVRPLVSRLSVISQAPPRAPGGCTALAIARQSASIPGLAGRAAALAATWRDLGRPVQRRGIRSAWDVSRWVAFLRPFIRREKVDVIHSHFGVPLGTGGSVGLGTLPVVMTLRGVDLFAFPDIAYGFRLDETYEQNLRRALRRAAVVTVASAAARAEVEHLGRPAEAVTLIPNGLDTALFCARGARERVQRSLGIEGRRVILAMGNLVPVKAYDLLVKAMALVRAEEPAAILLLVGDGPEESRLRALAEARGVAEHVRFVGRIPRAEVPGHLEASDIFAHPAVSEGFGNVIVEAMAMGRVVVARGVGVAAELIEDGKTGVLLRGNTESDVAGALLAGLKASESPHLGERARAVVAGMFSMEQRARAFRGCYEAALRRSGAVSPRA